MTKYDDSYISQFLKQESAGGILLVLASALAMVLANSPLFSLYNLLIETPVVVQVGALKLAKPLLMWVNDGFMAVFFLLVGLELKREFLEGELSELSKIVLPGLGAIGGMVIPALIYVAMNATDPVALQGWAIPTATDIAFALGVLSLLGSRVPMTLKVFLTALAIFDDIGAILIIAFFYTSKISMTALVVAAICVAVLWCLNRRGIEEKSPYILVGLVMWVALVKSGVHATLAGVVLAMFVPMRSKDPDGTSPAKSLEHDLHSVVAFFILPVFAFCNSGISFSGLGLEHIMHGVPLGITLGLFFGKQIGVFVFCWLGIKLHLTKLPDGMSWASLYGTALLCGIGFTMSLFVGSLAFEDVGVDRIFDERLGIILGSLLSGGLGYIVLRFSFPAED
ncbi:Na+/H+ antiporter NhaA [Zhongshania sp. BJYM1]|uniref:Na+/H+ antiporter NhaA n=1 Tax=Zhongshania aquatica TaxID=2965069 RepID=UPI0022B41BC2|nr:Na+/H+ antiporter NhaA [Marortus sp. BJYM1]